MLQAVSFPRVVDISLYVDVFPAVDTNGRRDLGFPTAQAGGLLDAGGGTHGLLYPNRKP